MKRSLLFLPVLSLLGLSPACSDPIQSGRIDDLGNEISGIPKGEYHRAGQPCVVCHSKSGPASNSVFTVAGTVFAGPQTKIGVDKVEVRMTDSAGTKHIATTNCVGNFFVKPEQWEPKFPILVAVAKGGLVSRMQSVIGREPDCATCHTVRNDRDPTTQLVQVYLSPTGTVPASPTTEPCPVEPRLE